MHSEVRPKHAFGKPPLGQGKVVMLPTGVVDARNHKDPFIIKEQFEEYENFDKRSYFASSLDDHDKQYMEDESIREKTNGFGGWHYPGEDNTEKNKKRKKKQRR